MKRMKRSLAVISGIILVTALMLVAGIKNTRHNLSSGGIGDIKSGETSLVCIFCHTSHLGNAVAPLWNRQNGAPVYTLYDSTTLRSIPGQPDGPSKLCLSCHDGTIALGKVMNPNKEFGMSNSSLGRIPPGRRSNLGSDLSDDHPISFAAASAVNASPELNHPPVGDPVRYDFNGKVQCTSCHDPHKDIYGDFLVKNNQGASICKTCHQPTGYTGISTHDTSTATWNGSGQNPWPHTGNTTVMGNSCLNCHYSHGAGGKHRLLSSNVEEQVCFACHNGRVGIDIEAVSRKQNTHRVSVYSGIHDPAEDILSGSKHVECADCHNPHRLNSTTAGAPNVPGRLAGVPGMAITGNMVAESQYEYEVCLKCHGQNRYKVATPVNRVFTYSNIRLAFSPSNASYHAVAAQGTASRVPSLKPPYTASSRLYCTDCHNNDSGPAGPHGSRWDYILERRYEISDFVNWNEAYYDLCFKCHDPNLLFSESISGFKYHKKHVQDKDTPCSVCHDPHGSTGNIGLLNFNTDVAFPNRDGLLKFEVIGNKGYCYMDCHGKDHDPKDYERR
ncbi:MAG: hypothetical protein GY940_34870 [bacterium]|nr:hypothetical protein [bacterium]